MFEKVTRSQHGRQRLRQAGQQIDLRHTHTRTHIFGSEAGRDGALGELTLWCEKAAWAVLRQFACAELTHTSRVHAPVTVATDGESAIGPKLLPACLQGTRFRRF